MGPGDRIGRYVLEELLGEGGMGRVYRAYDATLRRRVAIKLLRPELLKDESGAPANVDRILREARMAASLDHHNVVSIFDVGEHEGTPFIVMELVKGRPLRALVGSSGAAVTSLERMGWLTDAARALAAAHKAGLVHRDVKPENILVRDDGVVKVLDFGIARLDRTPSLRPPAPSGEQAAVATAETVESLAATLDRSTIAGTPAYMAPEQIRRDHVDARADQFAWGVVAYELLSGTLPWTSARGNLALLVGILEKDPPPLDAEKLGVPELFMAAVMRALSKKPADRFGSMEELLVAVGAPLSVATATISGPFTTVPPPALASAPTISATASAHSLGPAASLAVSRSKRRRTRWVVLGGLAAAGTVAAFALGTRRGTTPPAAPAAVTPAPAAEAAFHPHDARRLTYDQGCEEYPTLTPDGRSVAFDASVGDDTQIVVLDLASGAQRRITTEPGWHFAPAISPDGSTIAYVRQRGDDVGTWLVPFDGSAPPHKLVDGRMRPAWSPDGHAIWAGPADAPRRIELAGGAVTRTLQPPDGYFLVRLRELPDGRVVARLLERETKLGRGLVLYGAEGGPPATLFADDTEDAIGLYPDGRALLAPKLLPTGRVELWRVPLDGTPPSLLPGNAVLPRKGIELSRDGRQVLWSTCSTEQDLAVLRGTPVVASQLLPKTEWTDEQPAGIPGSASRVVVVSDRSGKRQLWVVDVEGKEKDAARRLPTGDLEAAAPTVSPDGRFVAFTAIGKGIHVVALDGSGEVRRLTSGGDDTGASFSQDGADVYFTTRSAGGKRAVARIPFDGSRSAETLVESAERPSASPVDERLAYVALVGEAGTPMMLDLRTTRSRPLSPALHLGSYGAVRFAPDGKRVLVSVGLTQLAEVDAATGAVARRFDSGDQITSTTYLGKDIVVSRVGWRGDLWSASDPWGRGDP
ncbi:MAG TPA: protein kinase [Polyangiaceae bacterium]|nr:protein kinase [Polyangiaceae bacterium]